MAGNGKPRLSVFKGREAKLNRAVLLILSQESPLSIRQVHKKVRTYRGLNHTRYRVVNRRMKSLEEEGYIERVRTEKIQQGFIAKLYQMTLRAYLAFALDCTDINELILSAEESHITSILAVFVGMKP